MADFRGYQLDCRLVRFGLLSKGRYNSRARQQLQIGKRDRDFAGSDGSDGHGGGGGGWGSFF